MHKKLGKLLLTLVLGVSAIQTWKHVRQPNLEDFRVYETAGMLVREHESPHIYDDADTGVDPQLRLASPDTSFARVARSLGVSQTRLYVYPPLLADLMVPFTFVSPREAAAIWLVCNAAAIVVVAGLIVSMLGIRWKSFGSAAILIGLCTYLPVISCILWGQIVVFLLLLWSLGMCFYVRRWTHSSAFVMALAAAIKLTPIVVVVPLVLWKDWKWVRAYAVALATLIGVICLVNTPACLVNYGRHVIPSMSAGIPQSANKSLLAAVQLFYASQQGGSVEQAAKSIPHGVNFFGKVCGLVSLLVASGLVAWSRWSLSALERATVLALFALLSVPIAPVSWEHAYAVCFPALALLWARVIREGSSRGYLLFLTFCSLELTWFVPSFLLLKALHGRELGLAAMITPVCAIALVFSELYFMKARHSSSVHEAILAA